MFKVGSNSSVDVAYGDSMFIIHCMHASTLATMGFILIKVNMKALQEKLTTAWRAATAKADVRVRACAQGRDVGHAGLHGIAGVHHSIKRQAAHRAGMRPRWRAHFLLLLRLLDETRAPKPLCGEESRRYRGDQANPRAVDEATRRGRRLCEVGGRRRGRQRR